MSDIFISYKREEQPVARKLANALEGEGWSIWWDPKLRAGEHFDDVIEKALNEAKCVVVLWSERSVQSQYVKDEATYALDRKKLVPVAIEHVNLPFRFRGVQTLNLVGWDGSKDFSEFRRLVDDISAILGPSPTSVTATEEQRRLETEEHRKVQEAQPHEQERQRSQEARRKPDEANRRRIDQEVRNPWRKYGPVVATVALVLVIFSFVFWWPKRQEAPVMEAEGRKEPIKEAPMVKPQPPKEIVAPAPEKKPEGQKEIVTEIPDIRGVVGALKQEKPVLSPEMVVIPAGLFRMGDLQGVGFPNEVPVRTVRIEKPLAIGRYEVTFEEYDQFAAATGRQLPDDGGWGRGRRPVINVSWQDAVEYAKWLSVQIGKRYRLPTEVEWEYAARAGMGTAYWWGNEMKSGMAHCSDCGSPWDSKQPAPVGSFKPNPFGLYDTAGNVWESVEDCWHDSYRGAPANSSAWGQESGGNCDRRVMRGGSWAGDSRFLRASVRISDLAGLRGSNTGFRLAQDID
jgi:formylglycine-generating enzyme required for sulfatase activity